MKLKDLKRMLNKCSKEQLEQPLFYNSEEFSVSGIAKVVRAKANLYNNYEDDPSSLKTMKELKELYFNDKEDIEACDLSIPKGAFVMEF